MRVAGCGGYHGHILLDAIDHHHRAAVAQRQGLRGLTLRFDQQQIVNFRDTVTSSLYAHGVEAVADRGEPADGGFVLQPAVNALPAFLTQTPRQHQLLLHQRRQKTTLLPEGIKHGACHGKVDVLTNHVRQLKRPHREASAVSQGGVNHLGRCHLLFQRAPGFRVERARHAVDDKPRRGLAAYRLLSPAQRQLAQRIGHFW